MDYNYTNMAPMTPVPEPKKKGAGKALVFLIGLLIGACVAAVLVLTLARTKGGHAKGAKLEGRGYDTPEEAVEAYLENLKAGDFNGIVSTFAMESYNENYNTRAYYEKTHAFSVMGNNGQQYVKLGDDSDLVTAVNLENRRAYIAANVYRQITVSMLAKVDNEDLKKGYTGGETYVLNDNRQIDDLMGFLDTAPGLKNMKIGGLLDTSKADANSEGPRKTFMEGREKEWDGDIKDVCMEVEIDGKDYVLCMTCVCYDNRWYNAEFVNYYMYAYGASAQTGGLCEKELFDGLD